MAKNEPKKELIASLLDAGKTVYVFQHSFPSIIKMKQISEREIRVYYFDNNSRCPYCYRFHDVPANICKWSEHYNTVEVDKSIKLKKHLCYNYFDFVGEDNIKTVSEKEEDIFKDLGNWLQQGLDVFDKNQMELKKHRAALEELIERVKKGEARE